MTTQALLRLQV